MRGIRLLPILGKLMAGAGFLAILIVCARNEAQRAPIQFTTAEQAKTFFLRQGFFCHNGAQGMTIDVDNYYVADHSIGFEHLRSIADRRNCGAKSAWDGIVWVSQIDGGATGHLGVSTVNGICRVWGNLLVAGDARLMDRIEELYRNDDKIRSGQE